MSRVSFGAKDLRFKSLVDMFEAKNLRFFSMEHSASELGTYGLGAGNLLFRCYELTVSVPSPKGFGSKP